MTSTTTALALNTPDSDQLRFLPEGPYPLAENKLSWVGIQHGPDASNGSLNVLDLASGSNQSFDLPGRPGFAFPCQSDGKFVVGCERTLGIFDTADSSWSPFCEGIDDDVTNTIINDGMVHDGNLIFGTKDLEFATKKAGLYLWRGADQKLIRLRDDQICSNGKAIRIHDGDLQLIDIDSPTREVAGYTIDIAAGTLGERKVLLDLTNDPAVPDGAILTPDKTGLIVSMFLPEQAGDGQTRLYDLQSGELKHIWHMPGSPQNTCPALVPSGGKLKLVVTTAIEHMSDEVKRESPNAGQLFVADTDLENPGNELAPRFSM